MKIFDLVMKFLTDRMPRKAALASLVISAALILIIILLPTLGTADTNAAARNVSLKGSIDKTSKSLREASDDHKYVLDNQQEYEDLLRGDRLVPHTERVAMAQMATLGQQRGLTQISYNFTPGGPGGSGKTPVTGGYKLKVEHVDLKIGAALDTQVYDFVLDLGDSFPGSAVVEQVSLERAADLTTDALNNVSLGQDSGLVKGSIEFTWRTAEKQEEEAKGKK